MKIRVILSTPDRKRFVCWIVGHRWRPDLGYAPVSGSGSKRFVCQRCLALGEAN